MKSQKVFILTAKHNNSRFLVDFISRLNCSCLNIQIANVWFQIKQICDYK